MDNTLNKLLDDLKKVNQINNEIIKQQLDEIKKLRDDSKQKSEGKSKSSGDKDPLQRFTDWWYGEESSKKEKKEKDPNTETLSDIYKAITGLSQNINEPVTPILKEQLELLKKIGQDIAINRKISEGSLQYDKESAQYRNLSGREITSDVSGKTVKEGGYIDFETAGNSLAGQSKAAIERAKKKNSLDLAPVSKKPSDISVSEEDDNVQSAQEIIADNSKEDLEITKEIRDLNKEQLEELKKITDVLGAGGPGAGLSSTKTAKEKKEEIEAKEEDSGLGDALSVLGDVTGQGKKGKKGKVPGKAAGKASLGSKALKFLGGKGGLMVGGALAVGAGAYTAYKGFTGAEEEKQQELAAVDQAVQAGEITPEEAEAKKKELDATTTEKKGGAVGEGTGMAAGAIGGAKAGALLGTMIGGPVGTVVGGVAGGALGAFAGSKLGKKVGEFGGKIVSGFKRAPEAVSEYDKAFAEVDKDKGFKPVERLEGTSAADMINAGVDASQQPGPRSPEVQPKLTPQIGEATKQAVTGTPVTKESDAGIYMDAYTKARDDGASVKEAKLIANDAVKAKNELKKMEEGSGSIEEVNMAGESVPKEKGFFSSLGEKLGFRAQGGPVAQDKPYIVGEKGPELFIPQTNGKIDPDVETSPSFGGLRKSVNRRTGETTESYNAGPLYSSVTKDAQGKILRSESDIDIGTGGVNVKENALGVQTRVGRGGLAEADLVKNEDVLARARKKLGLDVNSASVENRDLERQSGAAAGGNNVIVNNNTSVPPAQSMPAAIPSPRNDDPLGSYFTNRKAATAAFL